jgi:hypothetical protein
VTLLLLSCSSDEGAGLAPGSVDSSVAPTTATTEAPETGVLYLQSAITATISPQEAGEGFQVVLEGTQRRTEWIGADASGVVGTTDLVEQWPGLGLDQDPPQAALVPADPAERGVLLTLSDPRWDEGARVLRYAATLPETPDARLAGLVPDAPDDPAGRLGVVTVFINQPQAESVAQAPPSTTTTTTTAPDTVSPSSTTSTTTTTVPGSIVSTPATPAPTTTTTFEVPPPPPPPPPPPIEGEPDLRASTGVLRLPSEGGSRSFTLRNVGTGVGSWATTATYSTGIRLAPSSGFLLPGSQTTIEVSYDGTHSTDDFTTPLVIVTSNGSITVLLEVRGDA